MNQGIFEYQVLASSTVSHLLFESPWLLSFAALVAAFALLVAAQLGGRARRALTIAGLAVVVLAVALWGLAKMVTTDKERLVERTRRLVALTAPVDASSLVKFTDRDAQIVSPDGQMCFEGAWLLSHLAPS